MARMINTTITAHPTHTVIKSQFGISHFLQSLAVSVSRGRPVVPLPRQRALEALHDTPDHRTGFGVVKIGHALVLVAVRISAIALPEPAATLAAESLLEFRHRPPPLY